MGSLIGQLITKMGMQDEPGILEKTTELVRLLELRSINAPTGINEYGKVVLCADLAAAFLGIGFDKENALKLSGIRKSHYTKNKRIFEKLLDLNKLIGINDICIQLSLSEVHQKATDLLDLYTKTVSKEAADVDVTHPQYAAMAVFQACKLMKKRISKAKILSFSNLRPSQWTQLELRWDKLIAKHYKDMIDNKLKITADDADKGSDPNTAVQNSNTSSKKLTKLEVEDYEKWKLRMLLMAKEKLLFENDSKDEKENVNTTDDEEDSEELELCI